MENVLQTTTEIDVYQELYKKPYTIGNLVFKLWQERNKTVNLVYNNSY